MMKTSAEAALYLYDFIDELYHGGVHHLVVSPGSRSTPLAMSAAHYGKIKLWLHVDERSAAFFALGMAKASERPVALLCTSGTAAANYLPAVVEAFYARVPLILLTADRPHELRDVGASQTINQLDLYGKHVKWFMDIALPENKPFLRDYIRSTARRAASLSTMAPAGPVHLNFPFREPLVPDFSALKESREMGNIPGESEQAQQCKNGKEKLITVTDGLRMLNHNQVDQVADQLLNVSKGLIVCGPLDQYRDLDDMVTLAETLHFPLIADPLSNLRSMGRLSDHVIDGYDAFLRMDSIIQLLKPDLIMRFGAMPISKPYMLYTQHHAECVHLIIDGGAGWRDPVHLVSEVIYADPGELCRSLNQAIKEKTEDWSVRQWTSRNRWLELWQTINQFTQTAIRQELEQFDVMFEGRLFRELATLLPDQSVLYVGNSMPVRDLDTFFASVPKRVRILANRGASGIDGLVSSALGASSATDEPVVLVLGDLSFFHDLNGLLPAKLYPLNLTIVLINNNGGGIFSFLPQAEHPEHFETLFGTPLSLDFSHAAHLYGGTFKRIQSWPAFRDAFANALTSQGLNIIELTSDRVENVHLHRKVWQTVKQALIRYQAENR
jgi:2-succinyl-5-enolpyruvyl-6-hydroxy-3-cyclohexene-1-carboxylate synthase